MQTRLTPSKFIGANKVVTFLIVAGLMLISVLFIQQATAQDNRPILKPPFRLQVNRTTAALPAITPLPLNAPIIISQIFDSSYAPTSNLAAVGWHQLVDVGATNGYTWGRFQSVIALSNTVWSAGANPTGLPLLTAGSDTYTTGMQALLVYGPLDLSGYSAVALTATYLLDVPPSDWFGVAFSTDGTHFGNPAPCSYNQGNAALDIEENAVCSLPDSARTSSVWVGFYFTSDPNSSLGYGAFIKSMTLRAAPLQKSFMPLIANQPTPTPTITPTPTPTATPTQATGNLYKYTFDTGTASDPNVLSWGGNYQTTTCSQNGLGSGWGNPPSAMTIYVSQINTICGDSPNVQASTNYEYSADLYVYANHPDTRFGLIFAANNTAFNGSTFNPAGNYYLLKMKTSTTDSNSITSYQLQETIGGSSTTLIPQTNFSTALKPGKWNNFKVRHSGNTFTLFLNGVQLGSSVNGSANWDVTKRKFGVYIEAKADNSGSPFEVFFDNVQVTQLP